MEKFFSIITVCLNPGKELAKTMDSVLVQKFDDYDIIIKDGLSEDLSLENIKKNEKITIIKKKDNSIYDAMNQALEYAKGKYILFLNAGDMFYDDSVLDSYYECIVNNNYPALVYCDYVTTRLGRYVQSPVKLTDFFLFRTMLCHQVCMIKKECYNNVGYFNIDLKVVADYDFLVRLVLLNQVSYKYFKKLGVIYSSGGYSYQNQKLAKYEVRKIREKYFKNLYLFYNTLLILTFPGLRKKIAGNSGIISVFYLKIVNFINRFV